jgi:hypothetical protein
MTGQVSWNPKIRSVFLLCYVSIVIMYYHWRKKYGVFDDSIDLVKLHRAVLVG